MAAARVTLDSAAGAHEAVTTGGDGKFTVTLPLPGDWTAHVEAAGFAAITQTLRLNSPASEQPATLTLRLEKVASAAEEVVVTADLSEVALTSPDPSEKVLVREELLDANPGRPGAPVSIPGLPIETASGGIKAPQFAAEAVWMEIRGLCATCQIAAPI